MSEQQASGERPVAVPRLAASVVLLRTAPEGLETLMLLRRATMAFAGGEWVFPGGAVDATDAHPDWSGLLQPAPRPASSSRTDANPPAQSLLVAACRETFEESGVLLARHADGNPCSTELVCALQKERLELSGSADAFREMLARHGLVLDRGRLVAWSNWVTPEMAPKRFDTHFFVALMPELQAFDLHSGESQDARWAPLDAQQGALGLEPPVTHAPQLFTLCEIAREYARRGSAQAVLDWARTQDPVAVMVKMRREGGRFQGLMPWDDDYASVPGGSVACTAALRERLGAFPSSNWVEMPRKYQLPAD